MAMTMIAVGLTVLMSGQGVVSVPKSWGLDPWYKQGIKVRELKIAGSKRVDPKALVEAAKIVGLILKNRPQIIDELAKAGTHVAIMAESEVTTDVPEHSQLNILFPHQDWNKRARGLGPTKSAPVTSAGEENLLRRESDRYRGESIFIHEFAHGIKQFGIPPLSDEFIPEIEAAYKDAIAKGLWKNTYAATNVDEYWAEGVQSYFDCNLEAIPSNGIHNHVNTPEELQEYDPELYRIVRRYMGATTYRWAKEGKS